MPHGIPFKESEKFRARDPFPISLLASSGKSCIDCEAMCDGGIHTSLDDDGEEGRG